MHTAIALFLSFVFVSDPSGETSPRPDETTAERAFRALNDPSKFLIDNSKSSLVKPPDAMPKMVAANRYERIWQDGRSCGPVSLYFFLRLNGVSVTLDQVMAAVPVTEKGCSLADLARAAEQFGVTAQAVKVAPQDLVDMPKPAILHYSSPGRAGGVDHFDVLVRDLPGDESRQLDLIDTTNCMTYRRPADSLGPQMSGYALIPSEVTRDGRWIPALWAGLAAALAANAVLGATLLRRRAVRQPATERRPPQPAGSEGGAE